VKTGEIFLSIYPSGDTRVIPFTEFRYELPLPYRSDLRVRQRAVHICTAMVLLMILATGKRVIRWKFEPEANIELDYAYQTEKCKAYARCALI
jgi:hypothetical protein